ncbi:hypothetical protein [Chitinophaga sancti]|uniref:Lipocalin-like domain-containing protein n=1 Tax=Chitinophaga sancti TaxID=1004 RepID=A0A1K1RY39_9BACT|nr:hypothetical protein [Chitinophaga sancti]WQD64106.1 hypothetical protein U0033_06830 [Chitinophaga sancti]WQG90270.1 hypothetical protein SR876_02090 [Chitinophaga sancti]SFW77059.1 hypothetical protein SAMN05661012_04460 [Chitinophaga sancti]
MKLYFLLFSTLLFACQQAPEHSSSTSGPRSGRLTGTWRLLSQASIAKGDTTITDYTKDQEMIKIINDTHFAFLKHGGAFDAGGGRYTLNGDQYTEHLDYYNNKDWEGGVFNFTISFSGDTLIQKGIEKVEGTGVDHEIIERYIKVK